MSLFIEGSSCDYPAWNPPFKLALEVGRKYPCPYLPEQLAQTRSFAVSRIDSAIYQSFMDSGFRRSGAMIYQPICHGCRQCLPLRVPVNRFAMSKSQRRCFKANSDLRIKYAEPECSDEKFDLYVRYLRDWHQGPDRDTSISDLESFLYDSPTTSIEFEYRNQEGRLLAVGICDYSNAFLSSVYFYFDPAESARSLGTFGALYELQTARELMIAHYYLGYWVDGCRSMRYKANFRPCELLHPDGVWREFDESGFFSLLTE